MAKRALLVVDVQNDFLSDGALPAPGGDDVIPVANSLMKHFDLVVASQDWHPENHGSFASNHEGREPGDVITLEGLEQILWPDHCVQDSEGAKFATGLNTDAFDRVFKKGTDPKVDSYSAFFDNGHRHATGLHTYLDDQGVDTLFVMGLTTDYCVKYSVLDAREHGYNTWVVIDGCRGVENEAGDIDRAISEMRGTGARLTDSGALEARLGH